MAAAQNAETLGKSASIVGIDPGVLLFYERLVRTLKTRSYMVDCTSLRYSRQSLPGKKHGSYAAAIASMVDAVTITIIIPPASKGSYNGNDPAFSSMIERAAKYIAKQIAHMEDDEARELRSVLQKRGIDLVQLQVFRRQRAEAPKILDVSCQVPSVRKRLPRKRAKPA